MKESKQKQKKSGSILRKQWFVIKKVDLASLEFVHLPHPLSRDVFALIQFHIRLKSFQKYLVKWQQCGISDAISERIWPFIVNKYHYSLRFVRHLKKCVWDFEGWLFFFDLKPRTSFLRTSSKYVHLELYYSVDFPWWFDRKICRHFSFQASNKKLVKWQKFKTALCNLTKKQFLRISYLYKSTLVLNKKLSALQFNVPIQDGSIGEASAADISYYYYYILLTCIITQPILAHPPIKLPTQLGPLPLLITEKNIPFRINKTKTLIHS